MLHDLTRWRAAQARVRELEHQVTLAMDTVLAQRHGIDPSQAQADLAAARHEADRALQACLAEARRTRRVHRNLGLSSVSSR